MVVLYIFIFFFGVISTGIAIWAYKAYIRRRDFRQETKRRQKLAEKDGWTKTKGFEHWSDRRRMEKWRETIKDDLEMSIWIEENIKGYFKTERIYGKRYIKFAEDEDGMAFKLRWC